MHSSLPDPVAVSTPIRIAAAIIADQDGRIVLVKKRDTKFFMQPGGKLHHGETAPDALARELNEELGCTVVQTEVVGVVCAQAGNEPVHNVEALLLSTQIPVHIRTPREV